MARKRIPSVKSVMTTFPYSVDVSDPIQTALDLMDEHDIRHLPVTDNHQLVGVIADRELRLFMNPDLTLTNAALAVRNVYIPQPYVVDLEEPLDHVALTMAQRHIGSALVTRKGKLVGIFSASDACRALAQVLKDQFGTVETGGGDAA